MSPRAMGDFIVRAADAFGLEHPHIVGPDVGTAAALFRRRLQPRALPQPSGRHRGRSRADSTWRPFARMGVRDRPRTLSTDRWWAEGFKTREANV